MVFWEGASLWILGSQGPYPRTSFHAHHAVQITVKLQGVFSLETRDEQLGGDAVAVAPDMQHALSGDGLVAHLYVDPDGQSGREVKREWFSASPMVSIPAARLKDLPAQLRAAFEAKRRTDRSLIDLGRELLAELAPGSERDERPEMRVRKMLAWAAARLDMPVSLVDAASHVRLSRGRARHLFVEQTGLPFRTYLLWLRLNRALELFSAGSSLTEAAHGAGFSDSSHLSRTFRRMFGITADSLSVM